MHITDLDLVPPTPIGEMGESTSPSGSVRGCDLHFSPLAVHFALVMLNDAAPEDTQSSSFSPSTSRGPVYACREFDIRSTYTSNPSSFRNIITLSSDIRSFTFVCHMDSMKLSLFFSNFVGCRYFPP